MKKYLVLNSGSSSLKFQLYLLEKNKEVIIAKGLIERIGIDGVMTVKWNGQEKEYKQSIPNHQKGLELLFKTLADLEIISNLKEIEAIGHRVVHGGPTLTSSKIIDKSVLKEITDAVDIAPLHNPPALAVINACLKLTKAKNVAVFDTAFHATIPPHNYLYGINKEWFTKHKVKRYGFHGISYQFVLSQLEKILNKPSSKINAIVCHLGNGSSVTAIKNGKSFNTTMGFTPSEGLMMGTRSGDIDFMIIEYISKKINKTIPEVISLLNKESGLKGLSGISPDFRDVSAQYRKGNKDAINAIDVFVKQVLRYVTWYANDLENNIDAIVFTAGIGENAVLMRELVLSRLHTIATKLDKKANETSYGDYQLISTKSSKVKAYAIRTNEELMILKDTIRLTK